MKCVSFLRRLVIEVTQQSVVSGSYINTAIGDKILDYLLIQI